MLFHSSATQLSAPRTKQPQHLRLHTSRPCLLLLLLLLLLPLPPPPPPLWLIAMGTRALISSSGRDPIVSQYTRAGDAPTEAGVVVQKRLRQPPSASEPAGLVLREAGVWAPTMCGPGAVSHTQHSDLTPLRARGAAGLLQHATPPGRGVARVARHLRGRLRVPLLRS